MKNINKKVNAKETKDIIVDPILNNNKKDDNVNDNVDDNVIVKGNDAKGRKIISNKMKDHLEKKKNLNEEFIKKHTIVVNKEIMDAKAILENKANIPKKYVIYKLTNAEGMYIIGIKKYTPNWRADNTLIRAIAKHGNDRRLVKKKDLISYTTEEEGYNAIADYIDLSDVLCMNKSIPTIDSTHINNDTYYK